MDIILGLHEQKQSQRFIALVIDKSKTGVSNFLARRNKPKKAKRLGRPPKMSSRGVRVLFKAVLKGCVTARQARDLVNSPVGVRRVQQKLSADLNMEHRKLKAKLKLSLNQKKKGLEFAKNHIGQDARFWRHVIFGDKERFCLDGLDGLAYHSSHRKMPSSIFTTRSRHRGGVMVWAGDSADGSTKLVFVPSTMNSVLCMSVLEDALMPLI